MIIKEGKEKRDEKEGIYEEREESVYTMEVTMIVITIL